MKEWCDVAAVVCSFLAAGAWAWSTMTVSREREIERRRQVASKAGKPTDLSSVSVVDSGKSYDLIATLRHQSVWNRMGALFAGLAVLAQGIGGVVR